MKGVKMQKNLVKLKTDYIDYKFKVKKPDNYLKSNIGFFNEENNYKLLEKFNKNIILDNKSAPTIGILINNLHNIYTSNIWEGVKKAIDENGYSSICYIGGNFNNPFYDNSQKNYIYNLVSSKRIDGILVLSTTITNYINQNKFHDFLKYYDTIPMVSIGMSFKDVSSVSINNNSGMQDLVAHLIKVHGCKKIALITGPKNNIDSNARFDTYKAVLKKYNIPFNPNLVISGTFYPNSGKESIIELMDKRKLHFDALIGSNDYAAINAIEELTRRGIKVPEDVIVVGFDDIAKGQYIKESLTTVKQPVFSLGYESAKMLISILNGNKGLENKILNSNLIIRSSCGCKATHEKTNNVSLIKKDSKKYELVEDVITRLVKYMQMEFDEKINKVKLNYWAKLILISLIEEIKEISNNKFLLTLESFLKEVINMKKNNIAVNNIIFFIFDDIIPYLKYEIDNRIISDLLKKSVKLIQNSTIKNYEYSLAKIDEQTMQLNLLKKMLLTTFKIEKLKKVINDHFPGIGIKGCYISIFSRNKNNNTNKYSKLLIAYKNYNIIEIKDKKSIFKSRHLLPDDIYNIEKENLYFTYSLSCKNELLGFIVYEIENKNFYKSAYLRDYLNNNYESLSIELGYTIKNIILYNKLKKQAKNINNSCQINNDRRFKISDDIAEEYFKKLIDFMDNEKPYIDPDLTLIQLAEYLNISRNHLSYIINEFAKVNFYDFINSYRIEMSKKLLMEKNSKNINILDVAYDSGFKSKSTFYRIFKECTQLTPIDYRKKYLK